MASATNTPKHSPRHQSLAQRLETNILAVSSGCKEWQKATNKSGYGIMKWQYKNALVHRLVFEYFTGINPQKLHVLHHCDNPKCCNFEHLFLGTNADNVADKVAKGRCARFPGEMHPEAKLCEQDVIDIRASALSHRVLADKFGVSKSLIGAVKTRKAWVHI